MKICSCCNYFMDLGVNGEAEICCCAIFVRVFFRRWEVESLCGEVDGIIDGIECTIYVFLEYFGAGD